MSDLQLSSSDSGFLLREVRATGHCFPILYFLMWKPVMLFQFELFAVFLPDNNSLFFIASRTRVFVMIDLSYIILVLLNINLAKNL